MVQLKTLSKRERGFFFIRGHTHAHAHTLEGIVVYTTKEGRALRLCYGRRVFIFDKIVKEKQFDAHAYAWCSVKKTLMIDTVTDTKALEASWLQ